MSTRQVKQFKFSPINPLIITINWAYIIVFTIFVSYGFYGAKIFMGESIYAQIGICAYLLLIIFYFLYVGHQKKYLFVLKYRMAGQELFALLAMVIFWGFVSYDKLYQSIVGDHFSYSASSKIHSIYLITTLSRYFNIGKFEFATAIHIVDIAVLLIILLTYKFLKVIKPTVVLVGILIISALLITRVLIISLGGGTSPHPPFQLFPIWLSTSFFGLSDFSLRVPQFVGLMSCSYIIYLISIERFGRINAFLTAISICCIPLLIYVATLVEASIWSSVILTIFLINIFFTEERPAVFWVSMCSLISIFVMMRITSFIIFPFFVVLFIKNYKSFRKLNKMYYFYVLSPALVFLPFLAASLINGTPATYRPGEAAFIVNDYSVFNRIIYALKSGTITNTAVVAVGSGWLMLLLGIFLKIKDEINFWFNRLFIISALIMMVVLFFSIRPALWGADRYKAEYLIPFIILGGYLIFSKIQDMKGCYISIPVLSSVLIFYGVSGFYKYPNDISDNEANSLFKRQTEQIYDYKAALTAVREIGMASNSLLVGVTYGVLPQILAGFTIEETIRSKEILSSNIRADWTSVVPQLVHDQPNIRLVLLSDTANSQEIRREFIAMGWSDWRMFTSKDGNVIYGVIRDNSYLLHN